MTAAEDREKRAAIDALVYRLQNRGDADDEPFAAEFIAALWGRGWRPIGVLRPYAPQQAGDAGTGKGKEAFGRELAAIRARNEARQEAGATDQEGTT